MTIKGTEVATLREINEIIKPMDRYMDKGDPTIGEIVREEKRIMRDEGGRFTEGTVGKTTFGQKQGPSLSRALKRRLVNHPEEEDEIIAATVKLAKMGDMRATELLWDRIDGKVIEKHLEKGDVSIHFTFVPAERLLGVRVSEEKLDKIALQGDNYMGERDTYIADEEEYRGRDGLMGEFRVVEEGGVGEGGYKELA